MDSFQSPSIGLSPCSSIFYPFDLTNASSLFWPKALFFPPDRVDELAFALNSSGSYQNFPISSFLAFALSSFRSYQNSPISSFTKCSYDHSCIWAVFHLQKFLSPAIKKKKKQSSSLIWYSDPYLHLQVSHKKTFLKRKFPRRNEVAFFMDDNFSVDDVIC